MFIAVHFSSCPHSGTVCVYFMHQKLKQWNIQAEYGHGIHGHPCPCCLTLIFSVNCRLVCAVRRLACAILLVVVVGLCWFDVFVLFCVARSSRFLLLHSRFLLRGTTGMRLPPPHAPGVRAVAVTTYHARLSAVLCAIPAPSPSCWPQRTNKPKCACPAVSYCYPTWLLYDTCVLFREPNDYSGATRKKRQQPHGSNREDTHTSHTWP